MVPFAVAGLAAFAIAGVIVRLANGPDSWLDTCVAGFLVGNKVPLGDGVDQNSEGFLSQFPYLGNPQSGFDSNPGQFIEPPHPPVPAGG